MFFRLLKSISDRVSFFRPLLLIPVWTPALLGFWAGGGRSGARGEGELLLLVTFIACGIYGINQIYDVEGDRMNRKNLPLSLGFVSVGFAWAITILSFAGALLIGVFKNTPIAILSVLAVLLGISYSAPPMRLKDRPIPSLIANALGHGAIIYIIGFLYALSGSGEKTWQWAALPHSIPYILAFGAVYIFTTVPDVEGDRRTGKTTLSVLLGERRAMAVGILLVFAAGACGIAFDEPAIFLTAMVSMPFYFAAISEPRVEEKLVVRANKVAVLTLALLTCFYFPLFFLLIIITIAFSAIYNRKRLAVRYP